MEKVKQKESAKAQGNKKLEVFTKFKPVWMILGILALSILFVLSFLYLKGFDIKYKPMTISGFWTENNLGNKFIANGNKIEIAVPDVVISTEVMLLMEQMEYPSYFHVDKVQVDAQTERIYINSFIKGIKFPFSLSFKPVLQEDNIVIYFKDMMIGDQGLKLSDTTSQKMIKRLFGNNMPIILDSKKVLDVSLVRINDIELVEGNYVFHIKINNHLIKRDLKKIKDSANEELLNLFKKGDSKSKNEAFQYIDNVDNLTDKDIEQLINDVLLNSEIAKDILLIADEDVTQELFDKYGKYLKNIEKTQLLSAKKDLLTGILSPYYVQIMERLKSKYFLDSVLYMRNGQPYKLSENNEITLAKLVREQEIKIGPQTLDKLDFCYDAANEVLLISYHLNKELYLIFSKDEAVTMTAENYEKTFTYLNTGTAEIVKDIETWEGISGLIKDYFQADQIFIRYMKADEKYAFVIASPTYNYQNYWVFAMEKTENGWTILEENISSLEYLNKKYPAFNMQTATEEIQTVQMHNLGNEMFDVIFEDLMNKGMIASKEGYSIDYCSYGNDYIYFLLSDGKEYVYLVYSMYLHTVYDKKTALKTWTDIPEIITLQEPPSN